MELSVPVPDGEVWAEDTGGAGVPLVADVSQDIAARLEGSRTVLVPGADHMLPLRTPARLAEIIAEAARP